MTKREKKNKKPTRKTKMEQKKEIHTTTHFEQHSTITTYHVVGGDSRC